MKNVLLIGVAPISKFHDSFIFDLIEHDRPPSKQIEDRQSYTGGIYRRTKTLDEYYSLALYLITMLVFNLIIAVVLLSAVRSDNSPQVGIIEIPARNARDASLSPTHFYFRYQSPSHFNVSVSNIYITVPGLRTTFRIAQPTLFEINFQGSCQVHQGKGVHIKLLVDDHLIIGDTRTPNVPQRQLYSNITVGQTGPQFDQWLSQHHLPFDLATLPIVQTAVILVGPGTHVFDIGVHHGDIGLASSIFGGTMRFKWAVINNLNTVQGLSLWTTTTNL